MRESHTHTHTHVHIFSILLLYIVFSLKTIRRGAVEGDMIEHIMP